MITVGLKPSSGLWGRSRILLLGSLCSSSALAAQPRPARIGSPSLPVESGYVRVTDLKFTHLTTNDGLSQGYVVDILQDRRGFMWFATRDGLNRYDGYSFVVYKHDPNDPGSLSSNFLQDLAVNCATAGPDGRISTALARITDRDGPNRITADLTK